MMVLIISLSLTGIFAALVTNMVLSYSSQNLDPINEFSEFENAALDMQRNINATIHAGDSGILRFEPIDQVEDVWYKQAINTGKKAWNAVVSIPSRTISGVKVVGSSINMFSESLNIISKNGIFGLSIPPTVKNMIFLLVGFTLVILGVSVLVRWKI